MLRQKNKERSAYPAGHSKNYIPSVLHQQAVQAEAWPNLTLADLVTDNAANRGATHGAQDAAA